MSDDIDAFVNDAFDTFINVPVGMEKLAVTERFTKLMFELTVPYGNPLTVVTLSDDTDAFVNDAFDTFINVPIGIERSPVRERFIKLVLVGIFP
jgi:hypothetical protein